MSKADLSYRPASYWSADGGAQQDVEIAQVIVGSTLGDTNSIVARPADDGKISLHAFTDDGEQLADLEPARFDVPLSLGELIQVIDSASIGDGLKPGIVLGLLDMNELVGSGDAAGAECISVGSELYPELGPHYDSQIMEWVRNGD